MQVLLMTPVEAYFNRCFFCCLNRLIGGRNMILQVLLFIFGAIGGITRYFIGQGLMINGFPIATLIINLLGAFLLPIWNDRQKERPLLKEIIGVGFFGAFTTFSSAMLDTLTLIIKGQFIALLIYATITVLGGFFYWPI